MTGEILKVGNFLVVVQLILRLTTTVQKYKNLRISSVTDSDTHGFSPTHLTSVLVARSKTFQNASERLPGRPKPQE